MKFYLVMFNAYGCNHVQYIFTTPEARDQKLVDCNVEWCRQIGGSVENSPWHAKDVEEGEAIDGF